ncbi:carboxypeptidase O-like [Pelobates fuscus]|uniref:carboxypeptidase O-like n=1 Tax=Pelobates fuscus TaxID=191477 RepID=UPI002FE491F7
MKLLYWSLLGIFMYEGSCLKTRYDGDKVLKITPQTHAHAQYLRELVNNLQLDLWKPDMVEDISPLRELHVRIPFSHLEETEGKLLHQTIPFMVMINDIQKLIDSSTVRDSKQQKISLESYNYKEYHPMNEIYQWMDEIKEKHSDLVTHHYLGSTYEQRPIYYVKIGWPSDKQKKVVLMDCGIHAREWIAVAFCQWFVKEILANYKNNPVLQNVLKQTDFYVIPVLNVDGYVYSWTHERLWRKNRSPQNNGTCYGVDLNRNFDTAWCTVGASRNCSSLIFCGPSPASELETKALVALVEEILPSILSYLTIHSYGQYILLPFGYTANQSENHQELMDVAVEAASKIKGLYGKEYTVGSSGIILYEDSGSSADWAADLKIKLPYTFELRDNGTFGFQLPPDQIEPTCEETMLAVMSMLEYINVKYLESKAMTVFSPWLNILLSSALCMYYILTH